MNSRNALAFLLAVVFGAAVFAHTQAAPQRANANNPDGVTAQQPAEPASVKEKMPTAPAKTKLEIGPARDALREAIHNKDKADKAMSDLNVNLAQVQQRATQQYQTLQKQQADADAAVQHARDEAFKAAGLSEKTHTLDLETMEFSEKAKPKEEEKK